MLLFSIFWALQLFAAKLGFNAGAAALPFQVVMVLSAALVLAVLILPKSSKALAALFKDEPKLFWTVFGANAIQAGLGTCLSIIGIALTNAINAGFLVKLATVTTTLFAWLILKERMSPLKLLTIVVMLSGAYLLTTKGQAILPAVGDLFILCACVCWSLGNVLIRKVLRSQPVSPDVLTVQKPLAGFLVLLGLIGTAQLFPQQGALGKVLACCNFSSDYIFYGIASGALLAVCWIFLYRTLKVATASYMTLMSMVTPIMVAGLAMAFLGERLVWVQWLGAGMIVLAGVVIYFSDIARA